MSTFKQKLDEETNRYDEMLARSCDTWKRCCCGESSWMGGCENAFTARHSRVLPNVTGEHVTLRFEIGAHFFAICPIAGRSRSLPRWFSNNSASRFMYLNLCRVLTRFRISSRSEAVSK